MSPNTELNLGSANVQHATGAAGYGPARNQSINLDWAPLFGIEPGFKAELSFGFEADHANSIIIYDADDYSIAFECDNFSVLSTTWILENTTELRKRFIVTAWNQLSRANAQGVWRQSPYKALVAVPGALFTFGFEDMWNEPDAPANSLDWNDSIVSIKRLG